MGSFVIFNQHKCFVATAANLGRAVTELFDHVAGVVHHEWYIRELYPIVEPGNYACKLTVREVGWEHGSQYTVDHRVDPNYDAMLQFMWAMYDAGYPVRFNNMINAGFRVADVEEMEDSPPAWLYQGEGMGDYFNPFYDEDQREMRFYDEISSDDEEYDDPHIIRLDVQAEPLLEQVPEPEPVDSGYEGSDESDDEFQPLL